MPEQSSMSTEPSEEELRAAYEAEVKKLRVEHIVLENVVSLINLGLRRTGLAPGTEDERDAEQVRTAIEAVRAMLPLLERTAPQQLPQIRDALSQLQLAFVKIGGAPGAPAPDGPQAGSEPPGSEPPGSESPSSEPSKPGDAGPAQKSGRLWIPGQ
jgi:hypothetical protein